jgi:hypothetical protein
LRYSLVIIDSVVDASLNSSIIKKIHVFNVENKLRLELEMQLLLVSLKIMSKVTQMKREILKRKKN